MRVFTFLLCAFLLSGCASAATRVVAQASDIADDAALSMERLRDFRIQAREICRQLVMEDVVMWRGRAMVLQNEGKFEEASEARRKVGAILHENFPPLVTETTLKAVVETFDAEKLAELFPLTCYPNREQESFLHIAIS